jgi:hypothetical protein
MGIGMKPAARNWFWELVLGFRSKPEPLLREF